MVVEKLNKNVLMISLSKKSKCVWYEQCSVSEHCLKKHGVTTTYKLKLLTCVMKYFLFCISLYLNRTSSTFLIICFVMLSKFPIIIEKKKTSLTVLICLMF